MSIGGPSALGTLLVQRLDAMLGTTLSQQANLVSGARPDAVTQPGQPERPEAARNEIIRDTRTGVDRALEQSRQHGQQTVDRAKLDAKTAALMGTRGMVSTGATPSAPTSLGPAARAILALLANHPDQNPATLGKAPLISDKPGLPQPTLAGQRQDAGAASPSRQAGSTGSTPTTSGGNTPTTSAASTTGAIMPALGLAGQLSQILPQILQNSGMFYESHLSGLMSGKLTLEQLQQEPQAQAGRAASNAGNQASTTPGTPGSSVLSSSSESSTSARSDASPSANNPTASSASNQAPVPGVDPQTQLLVRQQLDMLANQTFAWRGEAWPDAPMEWEVSRHEAPPEDQKDGSAAPHWATKITIHLPQLGDVQARLTLSGQQLVMHVTAPDSADLLSHHTEDLRSRCLGQGLQLSQLSIAGEVSHDDTTTRA
ncbi:MAG: flagellar hook-length control protein FliK [Burkholderiaceae bacterium]|nr:flagellar hook-length control protein FliK [Burkholderiaceae bacterium]